jgi:uncharacterized membrane protein
MNSGMWLALGGAASYGFAVVFDSFVVKRYSAISFLPLSNYITASILLLCYYKRARDIIPALRKANKNLIIYSVIYALAAIAFYIGLERGALVGQISSVWRVSSVLTVILAGIYLHEAKHLGRKIIGAILTTIGVFLVS